MYGGVIDVDSAHKMLDAVSKKIAITEADELFQRIEYLEEAVNKSK